METSTHGAPSSLTPTLLLAMQVAMQPHRSCLFDAAGETWTFRQADAAAAQLADLLAELPVERRERIALVTPNSCNGAIALLAILRAGLQPLIASPTLPFADLLAAIDEARPVAIIAENPRGGPAAVDAAVRLAGAQDSVRFVMSFGAPKMRGVLDLSERCAQARIMGDALRRDEIHEVATFLAVERGGRLVEYDFETLIGASVDLARSVNLRSSDRLISPLPMEDGGGIAAGMMATLFVGAELAPLDAPDSHMLAAALDTTRPRHLVWPASLTPAIAEMMRGRAPLRALIRRSATRVQSGVDATIPAERIVDVIISDDGAVAIEGGETLEAPPSSVRSLPRSMP